MGQLALLDQALALPELAPFRLFWQNLNAMRPWWPILLPLLAWAGWRAYRRELAAREDRVTK